MMGDQMHDLLDRHNNHIHRHVKLAPACCWEAFAPNQNRSYLLDPCAVVDNHHNYEVDTVNSEMDMILDDDNHKSCWTVTSRNLEDPSWTDQ